MKPFSFSLNKTKSASAPTPTLQKAVVFGSLDDDEPIDAAPTSSAADENVTANKKFLAQTAALNSKTMQKRMEKELKVDDSVYDYDAVWDKMQEAKLRQKEVKDTEAKERRPKYIEGLLASAVTRKLDHVRAEEKMMQLEREREGDEYADKEAFVTQAYKDQMAEVRRAEEEEKRREEDLKNKGGPTTGMAHFYRKLLEESEQVHEAAVAATQKPAIGPQGPALNLTITKPPDLTPMSDVELARIARMEGKQVELNDDNQIIDKRELLSAGLNLSGTNTRSLMMRSTAATSQSPSETAHRAVGTAASKKEINQRRQREIQQQMQMEQVRISREQEKAEHEAVQRVVAKRNNEEDVQGARERYLQRKRQKREEPEE